ncbi:FixJ family two-component response regulator [Bradyrhizobium elkanii]|nr:FixJ family two-component response regulator [Bradyrhizobium elkanii]
MTVRAMKEGAVDFLSKPFRDQELLDAVVAATERDRKRREAQQIVANLQSRFESSSPARAGGDETGRYRHDEQGSRRA